MAVMANTITSQGNGSGISAGGSNIIGNTIVGNYISPSSPLEIKGGLAVSEYTQVHLNNLYGNEPYDVVVLSSSDISGTLNYWGTVNSADILSQVYDWYDDTSFGKLLYIPYLQEPSPDSPVPPPLHLVANYQGNTAVLSWEPLPSHTTGWGYKVYYDIDSQLPPYKGTGLNEGNSPIDVGELTSFTLTGLDNTKVYCFTVTSYDNAGRESWYSKVVCNYNHVYMPIIKK
jgi:hypothetical protein